MLVMISPVPFLFSLSLFLSFSQPPLFFFLVIELFSPFLPPPPPPSGLLGEGAGGGRRGVVWMPSPLPQIRGWGGGGRGWNLKKKISLWIPVLAGAGIGARAEGRGP